eukprot:SM011296S24180  [mRNA]  locus=s11296:83:414:+ [translate_table: standard]
MRLPARRHAHPGSGRHVRVPFPHNAGDFGVDAEAGGPRSPVVNAHGFSKKDEAAPLLRAGLRKTLLRAGDDEGRLAASLAIARAATMLLFADLPDKDGQPGGWR